MALYHKPVRQLMKDMIVELGITENQQFGKDLVRAWFNTNYPKIKDGTISAHLLRLSVNAPSRIHYSVKAVEDDVFYQISSSLFRLYSPLNDLPPIYLKETLLEQVQEVSETPSLTEFAYEKDLQNFLAKNLGKIESGLRLYDEEGIKGIEFPVGGRFIDILALDKNNDYVVIELKVTTGLLGSCLDIWLG